MTIFVDKIWWQSEWQIKFTKGADNVCWKNKLTRWVDKKVDKKVDKNVDKMFWKTVLTKEVCFENTYVDNICWQFISKMSWQNVLKTCADKFVYKFVDK